MSLIQTTVELAKTYGDDCWMWPGHRNAKGYGAVGVRRDGKRFSTVAHRAIWLLVTGGEIPEGFNLDHICDQKACVNPDHLRLATTWQNTARGNSRPSINARKTHCIYGHPFDDANTARRPEKHQRKRGQTITMRRRCKACLKQSSRARYLRLKQQAASRQSAE